VFAPVTTNVTISFITGRHALALPTEKSVNPMMSHANARSFDSARLPPRGAPDDKDRHRDGMN